METQIEKDAGKPAIDPQMRLLADARTAWKKWSRFKWWAGKSRELGLLVSGADFVFLFEWRWAMFNILTTVTIFLAAAYIYLGSREDIWERKHRMAESALKNYVHGN